MDATTLRPLLALMRKRHLSLGGLTVEQQALVWALVWAGLPDGAMSERQVNEELKGQLAGAACFVDTDHVELRRWLVDAGWLRRDGYGREYRRTPQAELPASVNAGHDAAQMLAHMPVAQWAAEQHASHDAQRMARRQAWAQQQAGKA
jgi:hypothetical protein